MFILTIDGKEKDGAYSVQDERRKSCSISF